MKTNEHSCHDVSERGVHYKNIESLLLLIMGNRGADVTSTNIVVELSFPRVCPIVMVTIMGRPSTVKKIQPEHSPLQGA